MDINNAILAFGSLAQETRLKTYKMLVEFGGTGCAATVLSEKLGVPQNTLSFHLSHLSNAGLVTSKRQGRSIIYYANLEAINGLMTFMAENCCTAADADCIIETKINKQKIC
ncbi:MAG: helix-turn-helix transcriptional regulator [Kordiimonadaceae bacterium]|jgi:ArsR family transcriptional regulator, arsenate/arsenite/antimonite-responsive transcriptional repressor|nr:helix-turn-helix transcriptional regulator [Kordiimonadaceae bacterium]MBT6035596.1 helix-turn-helix transcriptional regulator [Kordiimonadaceae bacterium]MBT7582595.1 helix-turn-helix transcriptional regulator [Kordiimonadaceae bacterium]